MGLPFERGAGFFNYRRFLLPYFISLTQRRVATTLGPCFTFQPGEPQWIKDDDVCIPLIIEAGVLTVDQLKESLKDLPDFEDLEAPKTAIAEAPVNALDTYEEDDDIEGEMRTLRYAEAKRKEAWAEAEAKEKAEAEAKEKALGKEKSPAFNQVVFEAAVREVLEAKNEVNLTPKGMPKAKIVSDICGFDVKAIKIVQYCKSLET